MDRHNLLYQLRALPKHLPAGDDSYLCLGHVIVKLSILNEQPKIRTINWLNKCDSSLEKETSDDVNVETLVYFVPDFRHQRLVKYISFMKLYVQYLDIKQYVDNLLYTYESWNRPLSFSF